MHYIQRVTRAAEMVFSGHLHLRSCENGVNFFLPMMKVFQDSHIVETKEWIQRYMNLSFSFRCEEIKHSQLLVIRYILRRGSNVISPEFIRNTVELLGHLK